jgi:hypothetical protein
MFKKKECTVCKTTVAKLAKEHQIEVAPQLLPDLVADLLDESADLSKTLQVLRQTYANQDAFMHKENMLLKFELEETLRQVEVLEKEKAELLKKGMEK